MVAFAERVQSELLEQVPHSQYVVTIPKMLRVYFKHHRKLLGLLSRSFYETLKEFFQQALQDRNAVPGVIISIQTYGRDPVVFHPHLHCLATDGTVSRDGCFHPLPWVDTEQMMRLFRHKLLRRFLAKEHITQAIVDLLLSWKHPGFSVFRGEPVEPDDTSARERLLSYCLHPPFALSRLRYDPDSATVCYHLGKTGADPKETSDPVTLCSALDWLAAVVTHIPDRGQQLLRYYGHYSNVRQAHKKRAGAAISLPATTPQLPEQEEEFRRQSRRAWARLIRKIYEADPLTCPRCGTTMGIISFIDQPPVIKKILLHLNLWDLPKRSPPSKNPPGDFVYDANFFRGLAG